MDSLNNIDEKPVIFKRKYRFLIKLFKDAKQVAEEWLLRGQRPPLTISATAEKSWNEGGEVNFTFNRIGVEPCDEIWLGLLDGCGNIVEEFELCDVSVIPPGKRLMENWGYFENPIEQEDTTQIIYEFKHMRYRAAGEKWTNWSVI